MTRLLTAFITLLVTGAAWAAPLGTAARSVIPKDAQQVISVDYRKLKDSPSALQLKQRLLPEDLKQFEQSLRGIGIVPDRDLEQLVFATFRTPKFGLRMVGIANTPPLRRKVEKGLIAKKIKATRHRQARMWPMGGGTQMVFLEEDVILFGEPNSVKAALDARDGVAESFLSNSQLNDLMSNVDSGAVWSILDQQGTQNMMRSTLGEAARLADYENVKKRLLGSRYTMDFGGTVNFDLDVVTSDAFTATALSSLVKAGVMYRRSSGNAAEKAALENVTIDSDNTNLRVHFRTDERRFRSLIDTDLFASMAR